MKGHPEQALVHDTVDPNELWHRRLAHVHYRALTLQAKMLKVFQKFKQNMKGSIEDVRKEKTQRRHFQAARAKQKESLKSSTLMYADQCHQVH